MTVRNGWHGVRNLVLLFVMVVFAASCSSSKTIIHGLDEKEANDIIVFLDAKNIRADKVQTADAGGGGQKVVVWDIIVAEQDATRAMALLSASGLPRRQGQNLLSIFSSGGLVPSEFEQNIRYERGLASDIANTIRKIDGVIDADLQLSFPEKDPLNPNQPATKATASVYVKHTGVLDDPNTQLIPRIRRLVASSVQGLDFDNVTVIPDRARFAETALGANLAERPQDKDFVNIWSVTVATDSVTNFRLIFFSFSILLLILLLGFIWIIWKFYPLIDPLGGMKEFFAVHPYSFDQKKKKKKEKKEKEETEEETEEEAPKDSEETPEEELDDEASDEPDEDLEDEEDEEGTVT